MANRLEAAIQEQVDRVPYPSLDSLRVSRDDYGAAVSWSTPEGTRVALLDANGNVHASGLVT